MGIATRKMLKRSTLSRGRLALRCFPTQKGQHINSVRINTNQEQIRGLHTLSQQKYFTCYANNQLVNQVMIRSFCSDKYPSHMKLEMPALSPTMTSGTVIAWTKSEGDFVKTDEVIAEIETDKAKMDWASVDEGYIAKIFVQPGTEVQVGQVIAILVEEKGDVAAFADYPVPEIAAVAEAEPEPKQDAPKAAAPKEEPKKAEPKAAAPPPKPKPAPAPAAAPVDDVDFTDVPNSELRQRHASQVTATKQNVPHYYLTIDCQIDNLLGLQAQLNGRSKDSAISVDDFVVKASAMALRKVPQVNASWNGSSIRQYRKVHINVTANAKDAVYTPLITNTDNLGLVSISKQRVSLLEKANEQTLSEAEQRVGTFTVASLESYGVQQAWSVVNAPQACILSVGRIEKRPVLGKGDTVPKVGNFLTCTLSCDHRVVDGAVGAMWLKEFRTLMEDPVTLML